MDIVKTYIQKWGSLSLRIPMQIAKQLKLHSGSPVTIEIENDRIIIRSPKYHLDTMLKGIIKKNLYHQIFDDRNEDW